VHNILTLFLTEVVLAGIFSKKKCISHKVLEMEFLIQYKISKILPCYLFPRGEGKIKFDGTLQFSRRSPNGIKNVNQTISLTKCQRYSVTNTILVYYRKYSSIKHI